LSGAPDRLREQLAAIGEELGIERNIGQQRHAQLVAVGAELAAEREHAAQLRAQLTAVGEELAVERNVRRRLHEQLASVGEELRVLREHAALVDEQLSALTRRIVRNHGSLSEADLQAADPKIWALAVERAVRDGATDAAAAVAPLLVNAFPTVRYLRTMLTLLEQAPPAPSDPDFARFLDDVSAPVQLVRRRDADTLLLGFCGAGTGRQLGMPVNLMHRWFGQLGVHVAYLRDFRRDNWEAGADGLGETYADAVEALRQRASELGVRRILSFGNSFGGYLALRVGLDIGAEAVLVVGGPTNTTLEFAGELPRSGIRPGLDLRPLYAAAGVRAPRVHLVYSADHASEKAHALHMAGLAGVTMAGVAGRSEHGAVRYLVERGRLADHLQWLADPQRSADGPEPL
jgi:pimeloyl-ACP methyl ester carboxylesterase